MDSGGGERSLGGVSGSPKLPKLGTGKCRLPCEVEVVSAVS
jgi:hypothetical protein